MNSRYLMMIFREHLENSPIFNSSVTVPDDSGQVMIFGTDEFKINAKKRTIRFTTIFAPGTKNAIPLGGNDKIKQPEWVAIHDDFRVTFGWGNPFEGFPYGFPACINQDLLTKD